MSLKDDEEEDVYMFAIDPEKTSMPDQFVKALSSCCDCYCATDVIGRNPLSRNCEIPLTPARTTNTPSRVSVESIKQAGLCYTYDLAHRNGRR
jgi:hypothetical protein